MSQTGDSQGAPAPAWDIRAGLLLIAVQFLGQVIFVLVALPILSIVSAGPVGNVEPGSATDIVVGSGAYLFAGATALELARYLALRRGWPSLRAAVALRPTNLWPVGIALALLLALAGDGVSLLLGKPIVPPEYRPIFANPVGGPVFALFLTLAAPAIEEPIFRGVLYPAVAGSHGRAAGVVASAVLFGVVHSVTYGLDWYPIVLATAMGLLLGALRAYTGSLWPSIAAHAANNAYASLEALLLPSLLGYWP